MKRVLFCVVWLIAPALVSPRAAAGQADASAAEGTLELASFAAEMRRLDATLAVGAHDSADLSRLLSQLPSRWRIQSAEREYTVSSDPLRTLLADAVRDPAKREAKVNDARTWLQEMAAQADAHSAKREPSGENPRTLAEQILRRPEFTPSRPPSPLRLLRQRAAEWLQRLLLRLLRSAGNHPIGGMILFWLLLAGAVLWLGLSLFRYWAKRARLEGLQTTGSLTVTRTWQEWIRAARLAADRGDFREAVHSVYWASILFLEIEGVVKHDSARTPREYVRLLDAAGASEAAPQKNRREMLGVLTARLERVWYGFRPAGPEDWRECLQKLESMGCRLE